MSGRRFVSALIVGLAFVAAPARARAQELEPRAYSNAPVGFNFLLVGYAHARGGLSVNPSLPVQDARLRIHAGLIAYARQLDLWSKSGKIDVIVPSYTLSGTGTVEGLPSERHVTGFGDPRFRLSANLYGAPALPVQEFSAYKRDLVVGASLQVSVPIGQYDSSKAINLGINRWSIVPDIGFSKAFGAFTLDGTASAIFYSDNDEYFGARTLEQAPIYAAQANLSHEFGAGTWAAVGTTYYRGGRTTIDGKDSPLELGNLRAGAMLAMALSRQNSIKINYSSSLYTRAGADFWIAGIAWQYRWGAGF